MKVFINPSKDAWAEITRRPAIDTRELSVTVSAILEDVKLNGDVAIKKYNQQFGNIVQGDLKVTQKELEEAVTSVDEDLRDAINLAIANIERFHYIQKHEAKIETTNGVTCWQKYVGIEKVGLYIPGGTAPLFSTLLMLGIPAKLAGCKEIIICTPPDSNGLVNPVILYVANVLGLKNIYKAGGVQAIAAMAYGTETISSVYKIFGPGNQYVTTAKQLVHADGVAIDLPAGPSEVAVYADESCNPAFVAADLLSQAEHGADSQVLLVVTAEGIIEKVQEEINKQLQSLLRNEIALTALNNSSSVLMQNADDAFELLNEYAPEHLIIASDDAIELSNKVINAGSVFLGHLTPESAGDYASGTNHTLPTAGYAKMYSGVSLDSFVKKITFQSISDEGLKNIGHAVETMAAAEGLDAHKNAVSIRLKTL